MDSIKRLRRKIVGVTITSLSGVLIIMTASVNAYSFARTTKEVDNALNIIANNRGIYPEKDFFDSEENTKPVELSHGIGYCTYILKIIRLRKRFIKFLFYREKKREKLSSKSRTKVQTTVGLKATIVTKNMSLMGKAM